MLPQKSLVAVLLGASHLVLAQLPVRIMSFNIRYDNPDTSFADPEMHWLTLQCSGDPTKCRAPGVISAIGSSAADASSQTPVARDTVVGLQEVLENQLDDIKASLGSAWSHVGVGRDDGAAGGEFNPILFRNDVWRVAHDETKWLSETPDTPGSRSWGSGSARIVTIAVLDHIATGRRLLHANTHLDNASPDARVQQIGVAVDAIAAVDLQYGPDLPVTLTGDFNVDDADESYQVLVSKNYVRDLYAVATPEQRSQRFATYTGFDNAYQSRIDYIWFGPATKSWFKVEAYEVLDNILDGAMFSDHRPVVGDLALG